MHFDAVEAVQPWWQWLWTSGGVPVVSQNIIENGVLEEQDGVVLGVSWPLPSGLASGNWSTSNEHFRL